MDDVQAEPVEEIKKNHMTQEEAGFRALILDELEALKLISPKKSRKRFNAIATDLENSEAPMR